MSAIHPDAYEAYQTSHNLKAIVDKTCVNGGGPSKIADCNAANTNKINIKLSLLTPILPMLVSFYYYHHPLIPLRLIFFIIIHRLFQAEACKNLQDVFKKCPDGVYSEIKYDGERVQLHKSDREFKFYSRSLKPVLNHKVNIIVDKISDYVRLRYSNLCLRISG